MKQNIQMVDVVGQYNHIKEEVDRAISEVISSGIFIKGPVVSQFEKNLATYLGAHDVIGCANGTDALQIALMALELKPGDEVIVPAFTYVATAEVIALLQLKPVMVDVHSDTFNTTAELIEPHINDKTKAIVPVHLFGQAADMENIMNLAQKHNLYVVEDNAQAIGADYTFSSGEVKKLGTIGHIGCTSFYPSKNLGCYGDGGAISTNSEELAQKIRMVSNHGQKVRYYHDVVGVNSRLDAIQAAILNIKLQYLDTYSLARQIVAETYDAAFKDISGIKIPYRVTNSSHVFHQYTLQISGGQRDQLSKKLREFNIPSMIYYPVPLYEQIAYRDSWPNEKILPVTDRLCKEVLSLPIHTEMKADTQNYIIEKLINSL